MTAKKIGRGLLTALGLVLAAFFISPILILIVNSFKSLKDAEAHRKLCSE